MVEVSSPDKVMFPDAGISKAEVVAYYESVAPVLLAHIADRPLTLQRFPGGIGSKGFMQKNASKHFPDSIRRFETPRRDGVTVYPVVYEATDIPYLANQGTITFHVWSSTATEPDAADRFVIDLDPSDDRPELLGDALGPTRALLDELGLSPTPVATGSKGYHLVSLFSPAVPLSDAGRLGHLIATILADQHPDVATIEFHKKNRKGRVFIDWLRNHHGATSVAPWSLRPRPGAPVAHPFTWGALDENPPAGLTLRDVVGDPPATDDLLAAVPVDGAAALAAAEEMAVALGVELVPFDRFRS